MPYSENEEYFAAGIECHIPLFQKLGYHFDVALITTTTNNGFALRRTAKLWYASELLDIYKAQIKKKTAINKLSSKCACDCSASPYCANNPRKCNVHSNQPHEPGAIKRFKRYSTHYCRMTRGAQNP